jgi:hypothetical protein
MDRRRAKETGRFSKRGKDRRRDSDRPSADTPCHLFAVTAPLQKTTEAIRRTVDTGLKAKVMGIYHETQAVGESRSPPLCVAEANPKN